MAYTPFVLSESSSKSADAVEPEPESGHVVDEPRPVTPSRRRSPSSGAPVDPRVTKPPTRTRRQTRARKVQRLIRHVEPWSVLKISLIFYFCLWLIFTIAGVMLWSLAVGSGMVDNVEEFIKELFALDTFEFDADKLFRASAIAGLLFVVAGTGFTVLMAVLFNLISDLTGGIRISVVELETARPMSRRRRRSAEPVPTSSPRQRDRDRSRGRGSRVR